MTQGLKPSTLRAAAAPPSADEPVDPSTLQTWNDNKILTVGQSPDLTACYERWQELAKDALPRLNEMIGADGESVLDNAALLVKLPNDMLFVHCGRGMARMLNRSYRGVLHSELQSPLAREIEHAYLWSLQHARPIYLRFISPNSKEHFTIEQLVLPLAGDDSREPSLLLTRCYALDDKLDVLKAIFDHSVVGMIAVVPTRGAASQLQDGRIILINPQARKILKLPPTLGKLQTVRDLGPWFKDGALWTRIGIVAEQGQTHLHYLEQQTGLSYRVTIEPLNRFMLFSIMEVPHLERRNADCNVETPPAGEAASHVTEAGDGSVSSARRTI
jgi:PAS domain-containing protein